MACKRSRVQFPSAPPYETRCGATGFGVSGVELDDPRSAKSPRRIRERTRSGCVESVCGFPIPSLEEVPIHVVGGADGGVAEPFRDHVRVLPGSNEERHVRVAEVVGPHRLADRRSDSGIPLTASKMAQAQRSRTPPGCSDACLSINSWELIEPVAEVGSLNFVGAELERFVVGDPRQVDVAYSSSELGPNSGDSVIARKSFV